MRIGIIGAGAAGMMAAATILESGADTVVTLIEKNAVIGRKVVISGGGRCNVTTGLRDLKKVLTRYPRGEKFLRHAMYEFTPERVYEWFERHGVPLKIEDDLRAFPRSNDGHDVVGVFEKIFAGAGNRLKLVLKCSVQKVARREDGVFLVELQDGKNFEFDRLILTTGGQAYRFTGSTGDGYEFAEALGHTVGQLAPSLNSFLLDEEWPKQLAGLSRPNARLRARFEDRKYEFSGPLMFTHKGLTGPAVFALSSLVAFEKYDKTTPLLLNLDFFPEVPEEELRARLESLIKENQRKSLQNTLAFLVPKSLSEQICIVCDLSPELKNMDVGKKIINKLINVLKNAEFKVVGRGAGDEFVTAGGVNLQEVDPKTMESKICPGLYFAGEILDVDGFTGGFNLQASWATGRLCGRSV